jgi:6-phosphogluconolactonase
MRSLTAGQQRPCTSGASAPSRQQRSAVVSRAAGEAAPAAKASSSGATPTDRINAIPNNGVWANGGRCGSRAASWGASRLPGAHGSPIAAAVGNSEEIYIFGRPAIQAPAPAPAGIPPVMGAHLMASGFVAPISTSKGPGLDVYPITVPYYSAEGDAVVMLHATSAAAGNSIVKAVVEASEAAIKAKGSFTLVLSGGSLINALAPLVDNKALQWDKTHVFFVDERAVPHDSPDSTYKAANEVLLSKVPVPPGQVHAILEGVSARDAAVHYEGRLIGLPASVLPRNAAGLPVFDLILLGVGPDGHVASLFPNKAQTSATSGWVLHIDDSPKPPPSRITFSMPVINAAKDVVVVALGDSKAEVVSRALEVQALPGSLPVQLVRPTTGRLRWFVDVPAAQHLNVQEWADSKQFPRSA